MYNLRFVSSCYSYSGTSESTYIVRPAIIAHVSLNSKVNGQNSNTGYYSFTFVLLIIRGTIVVCDILHSRVRGYFIFVCRKM